MSWSRQTPTESQTPSMVSGVPQEEFKITGTNESGTTAGMQQISTVVGTTQVPTESYDVAGNIVGSTQDTPLDVNKMQGSYVTESSMTMPSTGTGFITDSTIPTESTHM